MNEQELKRIIAKHAQWVHWRTSGQMRKQEGVQLVLSHDSIAGANLTGQNLSSAEFHDTDLTNVSFSRANLSGAVFERCDLTNSNFDGCNSPKCVFFGCHLANASFRNARFYKCEFDESPMSNVTFEGSNLQYAEISDLVLTDVDFSAADCHRLLIFSCKFVRCFGKEINHADSAILEKTYLKKKDETFELVNSLESIMDLKHA